MPSLSCFILAPAGTEISDLVGLVEDAGWAVLNGESVRPGADAYLATTLDLLRRSQAVLVVVDGNPEPDLFFQAGMALAFGTPLLLIGPDAAVEEDGLPDRVLAGLPRVNAKLSDRNALRFYVPAFLDAQRLGKMTTDTRDSRDLPPAKIIPSAAPPQSRLEERILDALSLSKEIEAVRSQPRLVEDGSFIPDFAIWIHDQRGDFGNLVLLEVAGHRASAGTRDKQIDRLRAYASQSGAKTVFHVQAGSPQLLTLTKPSPWTFEAGFEPFLKELREGSLVQAMLRERNRLMHSAG